MTVKNANGKTWTLAAASNGRRYSDPANVPTVTAPTLTLGQSTETTQPVTFTGGANATAWSLQYKMHADSTWTTFSAPAVGAANATVTGLTANGNYDFRVVATNAGAQTDTSATATGYTLPSATVVTASRVSDTVIRFTLTGGSAGTGWTGYYRTPAGSGSYTSVSLTQNQAYYDLTVSSQSTADFYVVTANSAGNAQSNTVMGNAAGWQLSAGHFVSAKMSMTGLYPRPDSDTSSLAYHRNAYPGMLYEIPIGVQGGAFPFLYEIVSGPSGAAIGQTVNDADYGVLKWTPSASGGPYTFNVKVTDQDGSFINMIWTVTSATSWAIVVDSVTGNDTTGSGTLAAPYATFSKANTVSSGGKAIVLRAGDYADISAQISISTSKFLSLVAYPGESVNFSCSNFQTGQVFSMDSSDVFVSGIRFHSLGATTGSYNSRYFDTYAANSRLIQYKCTFDGGQGGAAGGTDNNSCFFLGLPGTQRSYCMQSHCTFKNFPDLSNGFSAFDIYATRYFLHQENTYDTPYSGTSSRYLMWVKADGNQNVTIRRNRFTQPWSGTLIHLYLSDSGTFSQTTNIEACYNTILSTNTSTVNAGTVAISIGQSAASDARTKGPIWSYRNTIVGNTIIFPYSGHPFPIEYHSENDIVISNGTVSGKSYKIFGWDGSVVSDPASRTSMTFTADGLECHKSVATGVLDSNYLLTGPYRTSYLGTRGAEIA